MYMQRTSKQMPCHSCCHVGSSSVCLVCPSEGLKVTDLKGAGHPSTVQCVELGKFGCARSSHCCNSNKCELKAQNSTVGQCKQVWAGTGEPW